MRARTHDVIEPPLRRRGFEATGASDAQWPVGSVVSETHIEQRTEAVFDVSR
jgi:hypothetical protein